MPKYQDVPCFYPDGLAFFHPEDLELDIGPFTGNNVLTLNSMENKMTPAVLFVLEVKKKKKSCKTLSIAHVVSREASWELMLVLNTAYSLQSVQTLRDSSSN